jgi:hypothetical protein
MHIRVKGRWIACTLLVALTGIGSPAHAVTFVDQIDRLQAVYGALLDYRPGAPPGPRPPGTVELALEVDPVPSIDSRVGAKTEPVHPPPAIARPRVDWSPSGALEGLRLGAFWIPPLTVETFTANVGGAEAEFGWARAALLFSLRAFTLLGEVTGPITDPHARDRFALDGTGADARAGWREGAWTLYGGLGAGRSHTRLTVVSDGSVTEHTRGYGYAFAGLAWAQGPWHWVVEQHQTEDYLSHLVLTATYAF